MTGDFVSGFADLKNPKSEIRNPKSFFAESKKYYG